MSACTWRGVVCVRVMICSDTIYACVHYVVCATLSSSFCSVSPSLMAGTCVQRMSRRRPPIVRGGRVVAVVAACKSVPRASARRATPHPPSLGHCMSVQSSKVSPFSSNLFQSEQHENVCVCVCRPCHVVFPCGDPSFSLTGDVQSTERAQCVSTTRAITCVP